MKHFMSSLALLFVAGVAPVGAALIVPTEAKAGEGHDAGYSWAESKGIDDPDACHSLSGGSINNSPSFTEGCLEYLRDEGITNADDEVKSDDEEESADDSE